jgi:pyrroline-5-carboxylate reductase
MEIVLIGAGNMGYAMLKGLSSNYEVEVIDRNEEILKKVKKEFFGVKVSKSVDDVSNKIVILAVKPQSLSSIELNGKAKAIISILAGVPISKIEDRVDAKYYIRAMPNVAAKNMSSVTSVVGDEDFKEEALKILSTIGKTVWLSSEKELDIATALAASSPAWLAIVAESLIDGAVNLGLNRAKATEYMDGLFEGVGGLLKDLHPALLKDMVTSPAGTTIAGVEILEESGVRSAFIKAMKESLARAKALEEA